MEHYPQSPSDLSKQVVEYAISDEGANYIETKLAEVTMRVGISCTDDWEGDGWEDDDNNDLEDDDLEDDEEDDTIYFDEGSLLLEATDSEAEELQRQVEDKDEEISFLNTDYNNNDEQEEE